MSTILEKLLEGIVNIPIAEITPIRVTSQPSYKGGKSAIQAGRIPKTAKTLTSLLAFPSLLEHSLFV